jgi:hypothetical protein
MLIPSTSMREYFREALGAAMKKTAVHITDEVQAYVVNLLAEFARAENVYAGTDRGERPVLADLLNRAQEAEQAEAVRIYKHMGDSTLYLTGFFTESVERELVSRDYYVSMGGTAYASVAGLMRPTAASSSALFAELSDRFPELVDLLCAMSLHGERNAPVADVSVLSLVERYRRTGNREILDALARQGVVLRPGLWVEPEDDDIN